MRHVVIAAVVLLFPTTAPVAPAADPPTADQKPLDQFVGKWKTTYKMGKGEWNLEERLGSAVVTTERTLGTAYIQQKSEHSDKTSSMTLITYDVQRKCYRSWWFSSTGQLADATGTWDVKTKTFTWKGEGPGFSSTMRHRFADADTMDWEVVIKDDAGRVLSLMEGKDTRVKDKK